MFSSSIAENGSFCYLPRRLYLLRAPLVIATQGGCSCYIRRLWLSCAPHVITSRIVCNFVEAWRKSNRTPLRCKDKKLMNMFQEKSRKKNAAAAVFNLIIINRQSRLATRTLTKVILESENVLFFHRVFLYFHEKSTTIVTVDGTLVKYKQEGYAKR